MTTEPLPPAVLPAALIVLGLVALASAWPLRSRRS
jgi:hypothetical protein